MSHRRYEGRVPTHVNTRLLLKHGIRACCWGALPSKALHLLNRLSGPIYKEDGSLIELPNVSAETKR